MGFKPIPAAIAVALALLIAFGLPVPEGVTPQAWYLLAMFVGVIAAIIGKAMPIGALSILAITIVALTGVTAEKPADAMRDALSSFSSSLIWLIGVAIMISRGLLKTGLGARFGYWFIAVWGKRTLGIGYSLAISELMLAPVTPSNTARGGGIIHPVMKAIATSYDSHPDQGTEKRMGKFLALVNYHSNPITSAMFITATAPNPLVVDLVAKATNSDIHLSWGTWALAMLLPGLVALAIMPLVVYLLYPPEVKSTPNAVAFAKERLREQGPMSRGEWIMLAIFALLLLLWADIPAMLLGAGWKVDATTTAFIGLSLLLLTGVLTWDDILQEKSAWDTIIWFGALIMMASFLNKLGLIAWFSGVLETGIDGLGLSWVYSCALLLLAYMYAHYMFASTTAHITAMFGAFYAAGIALGAPPMLFALMMAAASSLMMTLTHYATGTSPVIFGSGYTTLGEWWKMGFVMSVVNLLVFTVVGGLWWKVLGYW
ncbi:DASS family divalent anion:Na+ symporter [Neisseria sp. HSC-16F19]|nr:DASS family sodium-coupled anion symporter [Neisseria sp. HSC-16F19]MCP2040541.1 DASS family divalent anion:Na+ symporter [Neisseria sp. HSC-16F19]